jgi:hypothetical protein
MPKELVSHGDERIFGGSNAIFRTSAESATAAMISITLTDAG